MKTAVHPLARRALVGLGLPDPVLRDEFLWQSERFIDCVSNINPLSDEFGAYPRALPRELQDRFAHVIVDQLRSRGVAPPDGLIQGEHVLFTEGSVSAIDLLTRAFCEPFRDRICVCNPTFPFYQRAARVNDVEVIDVQLQGKDLNELDVPAILQADPKLTFLCSPGNPVGSMLDTAQIGELLERGSGLVVVDEAYIDFSERASVVERLGRSSHLVVLRTFSKAWGLAGIRAGAAIADPLVVQTLQTIQLTYGFGSPAQALVASRLEAIDLVGAQIAALRAEREILRKGLSELPFVKRIYPSDANFLFVEVADAGAIHSGLLRARILVADTSTQVPNTLRISVASPADNLMLLQAMRALA